MNLYPIITLWKIHKKVKRRVAGTKVTVESIVSFSINTIDNRIGNKSVSPFFTINHFPGYADKSVFGLTGSKVEFF